MAVHRDYEEFVACLNVSRAKYLIVGGYAVGFHGMPRWTKDMDFWVEPSRENADRVISALQEFFGEDFGLTVGDLTSDDTVLQFGVPPVRIDIVTSIAGVQFDECWSDRAQARYGAQAANYISLPHLIRAKEAAGREQDLLDAKGLRRVVERQQNESDRAPGDHP